MAITEDNITEDVFLTAKLSIDHARIKTRMPSNVGGDRMKRCTAPTLVMAAEKDTLFPGYASPGKYTGGYRTKSVNRECETE